MPVLEGYRLVENAPPESLTIINLTGLNGTSVEQRHVRASSTTAMSRDRPHTRQASWP